MKKKSYKFLAAVVNALHIIIMLTNLAAMGLILLYEPLRVYSAIWLTSLWIIDVVFGLRCPLTVEEYNLRIKGGEKIARKKFVPWFFKRYLNLNIPDWIPEILLGFFFLVSIYVFIKYLFF